MAKIKRAVTKKTRFEVFKRDMFVCQYCGNTPPSVILEVDHITPVSKEGSDNVDNLITACFDCNRGKAANELSVCPDTIKEKAKMLIEKREQLESFNKLLAADRARHDYEVDYIEDSFCSITGNNFTDKFKRSIKLNFLSKLAFEEVRDAMEISFDRITDGDTIDDEIAERVLKYFCGVCWNKINRRNG